MPAPTWWRRAAIILNAKLQRPGTCNAAEKLLVHAGEADHFLPDMLGALNDAGVRCTATSAPARRPRLPIDAATEDDWDTEYLALEIAVAVVDSSTTRSPTSTRTGAATPRRS